MGRPWRVALVLVPAAILFVLALSGDVYVAASPPALSWHVALRKIESIVAFAVVGGLYAVARGRARPADAALALAIYSGTIEIGQWFVTDEALAWNLADVACGAIGGALGAVVISRFAAARG